MKYLTLFLFLLIALSSYSQDVDSLQIEKILAEARLLGEEGTKNQGTKKLQEARAKAQTLLNGKFASKAYSLIGDLYFQNYKLCFHKNQDPIQSRAIFLLAYDMYEKAGDTQKMKNAEQQFPSMLDAFGSPKQDTILEIKCWINAKTTLRYRPRKR